MPRETEPKGSPPRPLPEGELLRSSLRMEKTHEQSQGL